MSTMFPSANQEVPVKMPSGAVFYVHPEECEQLKSNAKKYTSETKFSHVSDLQELDRILILENICFRIGIFLTRGRDYNDEPIEPGTLQRSFKDHSGEIRLIKKQLGMDAPSRAKDQSFDSPIVYIENLKRWAHEFGIHRDMMTAKAIELMMEISAKVTLHFNCLPDEQKENYCTAEEIMEWIRDVIIPQFEEVDEHFKQNNQRMWIQDV